MEKMTPLMQQYWQIKSAHKDKVLLFRMGDFFEIFHEDAVLAAPILGITLTSRNKKSQDETPMCGVPHHSVAGPINKLLSAGHKVAICDQIEDPAVAKGIVKRAVTRILSPGMVYDPESLEGTQPHYLISFDDGCVSVLEPTTSEAFYFDCPTEKLRGRIFNIIQPVEIVLTEGQKKSIEDENGPLQSLLRSRHLTVVTEEVQSANGLPVSAQRLLTYVSQMSVLDTAKLHFHFEKRELNERLEVPSRTLVHLELFETYRGEAKGSFFYAINRTRTSAGARKLKNWILFPFKNVGRMTERWDKIEYWRAHFGLLKTVRELLGQLGDVERKMGKIATPQCHGKDLLQLAASLEIGCRLFEMVETVDSSQLDRLNEIRNLQQRIQNQLVDDPPAYVKNGGLFRKGVLGSLDDLIVLTENSQGKLLELEAYEKERTGIASLKIRYNNVFGYYIEITNTHKDKVPAHYHRKQTLANAERFVTQELSDLEEKILSARQKRNELEFQLFEELKIQVLNLRSSILFFANAWAETDVHTALAWLAVEKNYCRPKVSAEISDITIKGSRHPVVEQETKWPFMRNDIEVKKSEVLLLTGPNMAGKSTLMRQVALTVLMAQMGSFVPAEEAELPLFDRILTRIGANDSLAEGLSTFMVEMKETAEILENATTDSLIILDEIGRGTSTYDGMSLAQALIEEILVHTKARLLFATHYHELTGLETEFGGQLKNAHMSISDRGGEVKFLYTLKEGPAQKSYGIEVAKLAGMPPRVLRRAKVLLQEREGQPQISLFAAAAPSEVASSVEIDSPSENSPMKSVLEELKVFSIENTSPLDALRKIHSWKEMLN